MKSPPNEKTRPTSDRLRETLFNVLQSRIDDETRILDLCAGTGAVGIEALSRGAIFAVFVDKSRKACGLIETNLDLLEIDEIDTKVILSDAADFLARTKEKFDLIFYDPPYDSDYTKILTIVSAESSEVLDNNGVFIAEHHYKLELPDAVGELRRWRLLKQGDSCLSFYEKE